MTDAAAAAYGTGGADYRFRGLDFHFTLSHGLFSAAGVDGGTRLLLKVFSQKLDTLFKAPPRTVLDAGCGAGILGICAARVLAGPGLRVRAQDRDELARRFTLFNARENGVPPAVLTAHTEPLLAGPPDASWDLILSNLPAKAGNRVLGDFVSRSASLLTTGGVSLVVVVQPLAALFRSRIQTLGLPLLHDESAGGYTVFMYGPTGGDPGGRADGNSGPDSGPPGPIRESPLFPGAYPCYHRGGGDFELEGTPYHIEALEGVRGFDRSGGAVEAAATLVRRLVPAYPRNGPILILEPDQGHFPVWLLRCLGREQAPRIGLAGRNILALESARYNLRLSGQGGPENPAPDPAVFPILDPDLDREALGNFAPGGWGLIAAFPDLVPQTSRIGAYWEGFAALAAPGGTLIISLASTLAERFDRLKPRGFSRLGDLKRRGFRALGYQKIGNP
jgi:SAM-dependent methyltransferase